MNLRESRRRRRDHPDMELTPLIDVVFLLLIFLIVTTSFSQAAKQRDEASEISVDLPEAATGRAGGESNRVILSVRSDGSVEVQGAGGLGGEELGAKLKSLRAETPDAKILVRGDQEATHGRMIEVLDRARQAGFASVQLAARKPSDD